MVAHIWFLRNKSAFFAIPAVICLPLLVFADHVPDNLSQDLDPNYIACLAAVDSAGAEFRDALQSTCIERMADICSGWGEAAGPSQVIVCLNFEIQRGVDFIQVAARNLPETSEEEGLFRHMYQRNRDRLLNEIVALRNSPAPDTVETAVQQTIRMASAAMTLFWLARKSGTSIDAHVSASSGAH